MNQFSARQKRALAIVPVAMMISLVAEAAAPKISGVPTTSMTVGQVYRFKPTATDADRNPLSFSIANKPSWASFSTATGELVGTPFGEHARLYTGIVISVSDGTSRVSLPAFALNVKPNANKSPTVSGTPVTTVQAGTAYAFQPTARDPEGRALTFTIRNKPSWATFSTSTGKLSGTPTAAGTFPLIMIIANDGMTSSALPAFSITVTAAATNAAPKIAGTPPTTAQVGVAYSFKPTASDANNDALTFSIVNKPTWASFSTSTGLLSGTPNATGTLSNITIRVTDGKATTSLAAFSVAIAPGVTISGSTASVRWAPPTQNDDGTALTNLAGYRVKYGRSADSLTTAIAVDNPGLASYIVEGLSPGVWYFAVSAISSTGAESDNSAVVSATL